MKQRIICKGLAVAVIILFLGLGVQPAVAKVEPKVIQLSTLNPDKTRYLANFTMDFGENITNDNIEYESIWERPSGEYTINVKINFNCPEDLKIVVDYEYFAETDDYEDLVRIEFCDVKDTVTIINGSNPSDIDIDYTEVCFAGGFLWYYVATRLTLRIKAHLTAYEYVDGEWVFLHNDDAFMEITDQVIFNHIRPSERTKASDDDCDVCPKKVSKSHLVLIKSLLNRLDSLVNSLTVISKYNPIVEKKYQELSNKLFVLKEIIMDNNKIRNFPVICTILGILFILHMLTEFIPIDYNFPFMVVIFYQWELGLTFNCFWYEPGPPH
jgi:hypothetical protein